LFAGRCAEWFIEAGFIAVADVLPSENVVCIKLHGLEFTQPMRLGEIAHFQSKIIYAGRSSLKVYTNLKRKPDRDPILTGFLTFVHVDEDGNSKPHNITLELSEAEDIELNKIAAALQ
jgi:acyl-CoA hydrolase